MLNAWILVESPCLVNLARDALNRFPQKIRGKSGFVWRILELRWRKLIRIDNWLDMQVLEKTNDNKGQMPMRQDPMGVLRTSQMGLLLPL